MVDLLLVSLFPALMIAAAVSDLLTMTIPNRISMALVALFAVMAPLMGMSWETIGIHAATGLVLLVVGFGMFSMGWLGGGDAKLLAAAGLWLGWPAGLAFIVYTGILGGVLSVAIVTTRNAPLTAALPCPDWAHRVLTGKDGIPYGLAISAAAVLVYSQAGWMMP